MANKRPDGDGLVRKRTDGRWEGRIVVGHKEDGKPIYRSVFAKTQKELMGKLHRSIETFRDVELKEGSDLVLGEWLDKWLDERMRFTVRESTLDGYRRIANNYIKPQLGDKKIGSVSTADVQKMYNWLRENGRLNEHYEKGNALSDSSVRGIHMMLHQAMDAAVQERIIVKNPTDGTVIPKANYAPKNILTEAQLQKFLDVVRQDDVWSDFFYTELTTGLRRGEICGLRWQDFDDKTGRLQIRRAVTSRKGGGVKVGETKTEKGTRTIQLPPSTVEILKARKKKSYSEWIFPQSNSAGAATVAGNCLPQAENLASVCPAAAHTLPRSAAHLRNPCSHQRCGCENLSRHLGTHQCVFHAGYIHPYDHRNAEKGIWHRGKFSGRDHVRG